MLEQKLAKILNTYGVGFVAKLKAKLTQIIRPPATGSGAESLRHEVQGTSLNIIGNHYLSALDSGTSAYTAAPSPRRIEEWIRAKGITSTNKLTTKQLSFAISKGIEQRGTRPTDFLDIVFMNDRSRLERMINVQVSEYIDMTVTKPYRDQNIK